MLSNVEKAFLLLIHAKDARILFCKSPIIFSALCCTPFPSLTSMLVATLGVLL